MGIGVNMKDKGLIVPLQYTKILWQAVYDINKPRYKNGFHRWMAGTWLLKKFAVRVN